ncbi:MAG: penicillin acylase family protein [Acidimicrobiales bacterium]|nr:penicillin acylase family protein [Acidimicrobiales bacterium]
MAPWRPIAQKGGTVISEQAVEREAVGGRFAAEIRWTTHGVAHIRADDWGGLGFGQGWACARDNLATIADQIVKVRSERARFHGPGRDGAHLASDFGYLALGVADRAVDLREAQPPEIEAMVEGYVAGYNSWVAEARQRGALPEWCRDADWIRPIDVLDLYAYLGDVALMASGRNLAPLIGRAEAPGPDGPVPPSPLDALVAPPGASNGWAVGGDISTSGHGMVLANPHFPWYGEARFWECHLTIPGELDVYGVSLLGTPGVQMGFNEGVAWAHTFSCGHRFTLYRLELLPGDPTRYRYGDEVRDCVPETYTIEVLEDDGSIGFVSRTLWSSHYGPMVNLPLLGWGLEVGFTYRDANLDNTGFLRQFIGMDRATDLDAFKAVFREVQGMPWVNTVAADRSGRVWYCDASATPKLSAGARERFRSRLRDDFVAALLYENRVALLDGSDPDDEWVVVDGARSPGLEPFGELPQIERRDFVLNANDSHWLPNPQVRLEGFSPLNGLEATPQSLRTRQNLRRAAALARRGNVTLDDLVAAVFDNASLSAELLVDAVISRCRAVGKVTVGGHDADLVQAADILERWDRCFSIESRGAALWREFMAGFPVSAWVDAGTLFAAAFDPDDPVGTPYGLAAHADDDGDDPVVHAMGHAVRVLDRAGVPLDAPLGDIQWASRGDRRIPVHGGGEGDGVLNVLAPWGALPAASLEPAPVPPVALPGRARTGLGDGGYLVTYGTSFLMAVELTADGPRGVGLLVYGQSGDPESLHHVDGTEAYAAKQTRPLRFRDGDIESDPSLVRRTLFGG